MTIKQLKTVDVHAKEWFDRANGNSYFSARIILNYGMKNQINLALPFQYGYGNHPGFMARDAIFELLKIDDVSQGGPLSLWCRDNKVIYRYAKDENCTKKAVKEWTKLFCITVFIL
jgi:hypothetical protein